MNERLVTFLEVASIDCPSQRVYSLARHIWVCATQQGCDFTAPDRERGLENRDVF